MRKYYLQGTTALNGTVDWRSFVPSSASSSATPRFKMMDMGLAGAIILSNKHMGLR